MKSRFSLWKFWSTFLFLFLTFIPSVSAEQGMSLSQAIQIALQNNKDLKFAKHNVDIAKARFIQAGQYPNPRLNISNSDDTLLTNEGEYARSIELTQQFPIAGRIGNQEKVALVDIEIALAEIKNAERKLKGEVASSFYNLLIIEHRIEKIESFLIINQELMQVTRKRYQAAEVSELDANAAQLEHERLVQERDLLKNQRLTQVVKLNEFLGRIASSPLVIDTKLPETFTLSSLNEQKKLAFKLRPDFRIAVLNVNRAKADNELAHAQKWEDWTIGLGLEQDRQVVQGAPSQRPDNKLAVNVSIPLPLLNDNQGRITETTALQSQALGKVEAIRLVIETEVERTYTEVQTLKNIIEQSNKTSLSLSEKNAYLARNAYTQGQISFLEVVQTLRQRNDLQNFSLNTLDQYLQALVKLKTAVGDFNSL